jgi:hypothetical protein
MTLNFPTREEAEAFRKRLMLAGVLAGTIVLGAAGGIGLANMSNDAGTLGAGTTAVSGSEWTQVERPAQAEAATAGSAWTVDERPGTAAAGAASAASATGDRQRVDEGRAARGRGRRDRRRGKRLDRRRCADARRPNSALNEISR